MISLKPTSGPRRREPVPGNNFQQRRSIGRTVTPLTRRCDHHHSPSRAGSGRIQVKFMALPSKLAAVTLAITLMVLPAAALATCWSHAPANGGRARDCQMMSTRPGLASLQNARPGAACCELSSGRPVPASLAQIPSRTVDGMTPASSFSRADVPSVAAGTAPKIPLIRASGPSLQAVFCVFLI
jgi:hypothetical protein